MAKREAVEQGLFGYHGNSMWPAFQDGDVLLVSAIAPEELRPGDCIVYRKPGAEDRIIHRVVAVSAEIRTRGDNRPAADCDPVAPDCVVGRVHTRIRHGRVSRVHRGVVGRWAAKLYFLAGKLEPSRASRGGQMARSVQRLLGRLTAPFLRDARVATFAAGHRTVSHLIWGQRVVGTYDEATLSWSICWPDSLWIDPKLLPPPQ